MTPAADGSRKEEASMERTLRADAADVLAGVGRHWGWVLAFGIVTLLAGILALAWPGRTVVVLAALFGVQLVVAGIFGSWPGRASLVVGRQGGQGAVRIATAT